jgi:hypothetical protein
MHIKTHLYSVDLSFAVSNILNSINDQIYDEVYNVDSLHDIDLTKTLCVDISCELYSKKIAFISSCYSSDVNCAVLDDNVLTIIQDDIVIQMDMVSCCVIKYRKFDTFGNLWHIYQITDGFIIHGEIEIIRINQHLEVVWSFSGADIFVTIDMHNAFQMCDDRIKLYDFNGNYYEVNYDGDLISSKMT